MGERRFATNAKSIDDQIKMRVEKASDGCWNWTGVIDAGGYGRASALGAGAGKTMPAHRLFYEQLKGQIPVGLDLDHLCRNRRCVNPAHLEPVTRKENVRRGVLGQHNFTHCQRGHEYTPENTRHVIARGRISKRCRACCRMWEAIYRQQRKDKSIGTTQSKRR